MKKSLTPLSLLLCAVMLLTIYWAKATIFTAMQPTATAASEANNETAVTASADEVNLATPEAAERAEASAEPATP